jgi:transcriptional regulator with XRE-family HTH domain
MKSIAERFKYLRNLACLSQAEFAHMIQLSQGRLSDIERGKNKPSADTLLAVVEFFNISATWLLQGTGKPPTHVSLSSHDQSVCDTDNTPANALSASEYSLLREYRKLDETEKKQLWVFLDFLTYTQKHNKELSSSGLTELEG